LPIDHAALLALLTQAKASGGAETANTQKFIERLCDALGMPAPDFSTSQNSENDYAYERRITFKHPDGSTSVGRIDLYKRGCFILESKQSSLAEAKARRDALGPVPEDARQIKHGTAKRGTGGWVGRSQPGRKLCPRFAR